MPLVPVGQTVTEKWPVLDLGIHPVIREADWTLTVDGAVQQPLRGLLHPGVRLAGPLKNKVLLNKVRIER